MRDRLPRFASARGARTLILTLSVVLAACTLTSMVIGSVGLTVPEVVGVLVAHLGGGSPTDLAADQIVWNVRMPRTVLAIVTGVGLALAGAVIQAIVRNPLGDPSLIGVTPGASLGAVAVIVLGSGRASPSPSRPSSGLWSPSSSCSSSGAPRVGCPRRG